MKEHWNRRFKSAEYLYGKEANQFIRDIWPQLAISGEVLAIAEGEGRNALYIAEHAQSESTSLHIDLWDYSDVALEKVRQKKGTLPITPREVDLTDAMNTPWVTDYYDAAICVFGHFAKVEQAQIFTNIRHTLKNGGWFVGEVYSEAQIPYGTGGPRDPELLYDPALFLDIFKNDFFKHFFMGEVMRSEGELHQGLSHVIQFAIQIQK